MNFRDEFIIGIDFGLKRTGLAICSKGMITAVPSKTLQSKTTDKETIIAIISSYSTQIDRFILGLPIFLDGKESSMTLRVKEFGEKLEVYSNKPVHYIDEGLTSEESENLLRDCGFKRKERIPYKDSLSAQLILNDFLSNI